jgi:predicted PurR-regulated permease PerM
VWSASRSFRHCCSASVFLVKGVPGAGLLSLAALLLGIMQLPVVLITLPVIAIVLGTEGATFGTIVFSIYAFVAGLADNVLKPLMLGRGLDVRCRSSSSARSAAWFTGGIIGLFIGPVALAVSYQLFWQWVDQQCRPPWTAFNRPTDPQRGDAALGAPRPLTLAWRVRPRGMRAPRAEFRAAARAVG